MVGGNCVAKRRTNRARIRAKKIFVGVSGGATAFAVMGYSPHPPPPPKNLLHLRNMFDSRPAVI